MTLGIDEASAVDNIVPGGAGGRLMRLSWPAYVNQTIGQFLFITPVIDILIVIIID